jgi:hypothetical protein
MLKGKASRKKTAESKMKSKKRGNENKSEKEARRI